MKYTVTLNGTDDNPYERLWGLKCNPFPRLGKAEYQKAEMALNLLAGPKIPDTQYIRDTLKGLVSEELIEKLCASFKPGESVKVEFTWPGGRE